MPHPLQEVKARADQKTLDRIAHSKVCGAWNIIENHCQGHEDAQDILAETHSCNGGEPCLKCDNEQKANADAVFFDATDRMYDRQTGN